LMQDSAKWRNCKAISMPQYGFFFDESRCTSCYACAVACKDWNDIPAGPIKWLRMYEWESGTFPKLRINKLFAPCYHCENPVCVDACPNKAMYKEEKYGAVLVDTEKCKGARQCWIACPYGSPQFESDEPGIKMSKCTMCIDKLEQGEKPVCAMACPMRALDFDTLENLINKYGNNRDLQDVPDSSTAKPAVIFKPKDERMEYVPYDSERALSLLARRDPLPPLYETSSDVTEIPQGTVGRNKLIIKPKSTEEQTRVTRNDEG
jgi:anaerobic dimethyl sulfoxide reductase subunit B (iron-sulfur subunit)